ncbi:MAG: outer membrane protein assembly factor BamB family protein [Planctomycetota bacterium]|jgi:parallel beta-helix repeat protein/predicted outer membrane repeat protein
MGKLRKERRVERTIPVALLLSVVLVSLANGRIITVSRDGAADFNNIQAAIDDANDGDTVVVADGTYSGVGNETIDFRGKAIKVRSAGGAGCCTIDSDGWGLAFHFHSGEGPTSIVDGFTMTNGHGILCDHSSPTITNCIITNNIKGIQAMYSKKLMVTNCVISRNSNRGMYCHSFSNPTIRNCIISHNSATDKGGGLLFGWETSYSVANCTITGNTAEGGGGGVSYDGVGRITNCIIRGNSDPEVCRWYSSSPPVTNVTYSNVQGGYPGLGNIDTNPRLKEDGYHLRWYSPCIDRGDPNGVYEAQNDIDGQPRVAWGRVDIGADEFHPETPFLEISPPEVIFVSLLGGTNPEPQVLSIGNKGIGTVNWTIAYDCNWLDVYPRSGQSAGEVNEVVLSVDANSLQADDYTCVLAVSDADAINSPQHVTVRLHIGTPLIGARPTVFDFVCPLYGSNPEPQILSIWNDDVGTLNWELTEDCNWLEVWPSSGQASAEENEVAVRVDANTLEVGQYTCVLTISEPNAANTPQYITANLDVRAALIAVMPTQLDFFGPEGGPSPESQSLSVWNADVGTLEWEITEDCNWLEVWPISGESTGEIDEILVSVDTSGLVRGEYNSMIRILDSNASNSPLDVPVHLEVRTPQVGVGPARLDFYGREGGPNPESQSLSVWNADVGILYWQITEDCNWLEVWPMEGVSANDTEVNEVILVANTTGLSKGIYDCNILIWNEDVPENPETVVVALHVLGEIVYVPGDYPTIQVAIDNVNIGGAVIVAEGIYTGEGNRDINFRGKAITVRSVDPNDPNIVASTIIDCNAKSSDRHRGFLFISGEDANSVLAGVTIKRGFASGGGGIRIGDSSPTIMNCILTNNAGYTSQAGGGGIGVYGNSQPTIEGCLFSYNRGGMQGGAIGCDHFTEAPLSVTVSDCVFIGNSANTDGGAIEGWGRVHSVTKCIFLGNVAGDQGGALAYCHDTIADCIFVGNSAASDGGAMYNCWASVSNSLFNSNGAGRHGGAIYGIWDITVRNSTFVGNHAGVKGGGVNKAAGCFEAANCIFWGNVDSTGASELAQIVYSPNYTHYAIFSCIQDDDRNDANVPFGGAGNGNIDDDPLFVRMPDDGGDGWGDDESTPDVNEAANDDFGDVHLRSDSPCINAGPPSAWVVPGSVDMDGQPRIMGHVIDMGADEFFMPIIVVTKPARDEVWVSGSVHEIHWESDSYAGSVDILFSEDGGDNWQTIESNVGDSGSYVWNLPDVVDSNRCLVWVVPSVPDPNVVAVESGLFTIHPDSPDPAAASKWKSLGGEFDRRGLSDDFGPELGCVKWTFETGGPVSAGITVGAYDRVHIACEDGKLYTLDAGGVLLWSYDTNSPLISAPTVGPDGTVYVGSENGRLCAIDVNGNLRWTHTTGGFVYSSPAVSPDGNAVYFGSQDGVLYALGRDGSELWSFEQGGAILASPAVGADGAVYVGGLYDSNLYALEPNDGSLRWDCNFESEGWPFASAVVATDGTIYQTLLYDPNLYAIEPNGGTILWSLDVADAPGPYMGYFKGDADGWAEPALGPDGTIHVSFNDPNLRAVDPNGAIKWVTRLGMMEGFTLTVGADGLLYAAGSDGYLCVLDANGVEIARLHKDGWLVFPVISADNTMIVSDVNNKIWAIGGDGCEGRVYELHRPEDLNFSLTANFMDFGLLAADWLACNDPLAPCSALFWDGRYLTGDINRNLYVDFADLAVLANSWLSAD